MRGRRGEEQEQEEEEGRGGWESDVSAEGREGTLCAYVRGARTYKALSFSVVIGLSVLGGPFHAWTGNVSGPRTPQGAFPFARRVAAPGSARATAFVQTRNRRAIMLIGGGGRIIIERTAGFRGRNPLIVWSREYADGKSVGRDLSGRAAKKNGPTGVERRAEERRERKVVLKKNRLAAATQ